LEILGESFNTDLSSFIRDNGLIETVVHLGPRGHAEAIRSIASSDAVLVLKSPQDRIHVPGKLYEALGLGRPILLLGPQSEASEIIAQCDAGVTVTDLEPEAIAGALTQVFLRSSRPVRVPEGFSAAHLTDQLIHVFNQALSRNNEMTGLDVSVDNKVGNHAH
jgi:hypothetical protein